MGALLFAGNPQKAVANLLNSGDSTPRKIRKALANGNTVEVSQCSTAAQIAARGGLKGVPANIAELIAAGFDPLGVPIG